MQVGATGCVCFGGKSLLDTAALPPRSPRLAFQPSPGVIMKTRLPLVLVGLLTASLFAATPPARAPLLAQGTAAPDFTVLTPDNKKVNLSDYKGSVVLVDFWATWCGPCLHAMPHMDKLHKKLAGQGLVVLGVCVSDERSNFDEWIAKPKVKTTYPLLYDPAGRGANRISSKLYNVSGIPTFYVIDRDGKVAFAGVGAGPQTEASLDKALKKLGLKL
jgi:thiol-disulfide isomerase/thioredoxin